MSCARRPTRLQRVLLSIAALLALQCHGPSGPGIARVDVTAGLAADPTGERIAATVEACEQAMTSVEFNWPPER